MRARSLRIGAFLAWALTVATLTHWPGLRIEGAPVERPDLIAHLGVFGLWGLLLVSCGFFGPASGWRNAGWCVAAGLVYAAVDEATQAIPILNRQARLDDYLANALGLTLGIGLGMVFARIARARGKDRQSGESPPKMG